MYVYIFSKMDLEMSIQICIPIFQYFFNKYIRLILKAKSIDGQKASKLANQKLSEII